MVKLLVLFLFLSCSNIRIFLFGDPNRVKIDTGSYKYIDKDDYIGNLRGLEGSFLKFAEKDIIKLSTSENKYLMGLSERVINNNELLLNFEAKKVRFHIIKSKIPYHFSLPGGVIFFSTSLIGKYIKYEGILISIITYELFKSIKNIYMKNIIVPVGVIPLEKILFLTKINLDSKMEINKWAFYALKRSGFDPLSYLSWIQTQNKHALDFTLMSGDIKIISKEEFLFKKFIVNKRLNKRNDKLYENSSKEFYEFIKKFNMDRLEV
ncbi:MAG: hypothetical protein U0T83_01990 [Bacteriovoracaceae bacterium]